MLDSSQAAVSVLLHINAHKVKKNLINHNHFIPGVWVASGIIVASVRSCTALKFVVLTLIVCFFLKEEQTEAVLHSPSLFSLVSRSKGSKRESMKN